MQLFSTWLSKLNASQLVSSDHLRSSMDRNLQIILTVSKLFLRVSTAETRLHLTGVVTSVANLRCKHEIKHHSQRPPVATGIIWLVLDYLKKVIMRTRHVCIIDFNVAKCKEQVQRHLTARLSDNSIKRLKRKANANIKPYYLLTPNWTKSSLLFFSELISKVHEHKNSCENHFAGDASPRES